MTLGAIAGLLSLALRAFLWSAVLVGLYTWITELHRALEPELAHASRDEALRAGVFFGSWMAALFVLISLPRWWRSRRDGGLRTRYTTRLVVERPLNDALLLCRTALSESTGRRVRQADDVLRARARASWASWGERLSIELTSVDEQRTHVRIASEPAVPFTLIDYGKGDERITAIRDRLERTGRATSPS